MNTKHLTYGQRLIGFMLVFTPVSVAALIAGSTGTRSPGIIGPILVILMAIGWVLAVTLP